ncbi:MAG: hypothetical protein Gaeavirus14_13 [Gaeavirus sp.]|uniref:FNIP repeat-containing protein n=1 Tax=Gaeavirus sp. TaxID=2487767 RepID=A0A3G5A2Y0_9VIRU|nr:MAG: hypothetical protein Gaeavirus14_13 [Gaeavirus sp.]
MLTNLHETLLAVIDDELITTIYTRQHTSRISKTTIELCNDNCDELNFSEYSFTKNIKAIFIQQYISKSMSDLSCFINLTDLSINMYYRQIIDIITQNRITELIFPDTIRTMTFDCNYSVIDFKFPPHLKKLYFGTNFRHSIIGVTFPTELKILELGYINTLVGVTLPEHITEIITIIPEVLKTIHEVSSFPPSLTTIFISYIDLTFKVIIPSNFTFIKICSVSSMDNLIFPKTLRKLEIQSCPELLNNIPNSVEELIIISEKSNVTNLPISLKKLIIKKMEYNDILKQFKKIPYGCVVTNDKNEIILI